MDAAGPGLQGRCLMLQGFRADAFKSKLKAYGIVLPLWHAALTRIFVGAEDVDAKTRHSDCGKRQSDLVKCRA
jgi:hypothetical protein